MSAPCPQVAKWCALLARRRGRRHGVMPNGLRLDPVCPEPGRRRRLVDDDGCRPAVLRTVLVAEGGAAGSRVGESDIARRFAAFCWVPQHQEALPALPPLPAGIRLLRMRLFGLNGLKSNPWHLGALVSNPGMPNSANGVEPTLLARRADNVVRRVPYATPSCGMWDRHLFGEGVLVLPPQSSMRTSRRPSPGCVDMRAVWTCSLRD